MNTLKALRTAQRLTMPALARRSGISAATISRIERGTSTPRPRSVQRLSAALGVKPEEIVEFQDIVERVRLHGRRLILPKHRTSDDDAARAASPDFWYGGQRPQTPAGVSPRSDSARSRIRSRGRAPPSRAPAPRGRMGVPCDR